MRPSPLCAPGRLFGFNGLPGPDQPCLIRYAWASILGWVMCLPLDCRIWVGNGAWFLGLGYFAWVLVVYVVELEEKGFEGESLVQKKVWIRKKRSDKISCSDSRDGRTIYFLLCLFPLL